MKTIKGIQTATHAFHLGFQNNQIIQRINHIENIGNRIKKPSKPKNNINNGKISLRAGWIENPIVANIAIGAIRTINQMMLNRIPTVPTVFFLFSWLSTSM